MTNHARPRPVWTLRAVLVMATVLTAGCLGTLRQSAGAQTIVLAPRQRLTVPVHENRPHWLLRSMPGWEGAHKVRFGGDPSDPTTLIVRVALFQDEPSARAAFARLTPAQLYAFWRGQMAAEPNPVDAPAPPPLPGDAVRVFRYPRKTPAAGDAVLGEFTLLRCGHVVLVVESVGVPAAELGPVLDAISQAVAAVAKPCPERTGVARGLQCLCTSHEGGRS